MAYKLQSLRYLTVGILLALCITTSCSNLQRARNFWNYYYPRSRRITTTTTTTIPATSSPVQDEPRPGLTYVPYELTDERCKTERFRGLRACRLTSSRLTEMASRYLCSSRDLYTPDSEEGQRTVSKRSVNTCTGVSVRQAILQALDDDGNLRELVIDRANHLYQTLFVETCLDLGNIFGFTCEQHQIKFKAAVFALDPTSNDISVEDVSTDSYCALTRL